MAKRFSVSESEGSQRSYSYLLEDKDLPLGIFTDNNAPDEINWELESLGQSDYAPMFLWEPDGNLIYEVKEA